MEILLNQIGAAGEHWKVVFVWPHTVPLWCYAEDSGGEILCWDGFDNAIGWIAKTERNLDGDLDEEINTYQEALAIDFGCTYYEAGLYMMLQEKGIIK